MNFIRRYLIALLLVTIGLTSCAGENTVESTPDVNATIVSEASTLAASYFETQTAMAPPATPTFTSNALFTPTGTALVLPSAFPSPTTQIIYSTPIPPTIGFSPTPTGTQYTPTVDPAKLAVGCNNLRLIRDESIPAGTVFLPNEKFTKTWRVENNGTCDWVYLYHLVLFGGDGMDGKVSNLGKVIPPGKWTQISVNLTSPKNPGTYTGYWKFGDQGGNMFGAVLAVSIVVSAPTNTPKPTSTASVVPPSPLPTLTFTETLTPTPSGTPTATP